MTTWYSWTTIKCAKDDGSEFEVKPGEEVTADKLNVDDEEFDQMIDARVVRQSKYPDMPKNFPGSAKDYILQQNKKQLQDIEDNFGNEQFEVEDSSVSNPTGADDVTPPFEGSESEVDQPSDTVTEFS